MTSQFKKLHDQGNEEFKKGNFLISRDLYTQLLDQITSCRSVDLTYLATILSNRAAVFLKLGYPELAWSDASYSLSLENGNLKAAYRLSMCFYEMGLPKLANSLLSSQLASNKSGASSAEIDSMNVLLKRCASLSGQNSAVENDLSMSNASGNSNVTSKSSSFVIGSDAQLSITYRDYPWECREKLKLSLKMIRQQLFVNCESICLQQTDCSGRGLVAKRLIRQGEVIYESKFTLNSFGKKTECQACSTSFSSACTNGPIYACPKCRECFCSLECYQFAMAEFHPVLCGKNVRDLITLCESFSPDIRTSILILKLFAIAKHKQIAPLQLPHLRYLKRIREQNVAGLMNERANCIKFFIPAKFIDAYRMTLDLLDVKFDSKFDFWVYLTIHRTLLLNCIPYHNQFNWIVSGISLLNHHHAPNALIEEMSSLSPKKVRLVATQNIAKGDEITVSYIHPSFSISERFKALLHYGIVEDPELDSED